MLGLEGKKGEGVKEGKGRQGQGGGSEIRGEKGGIGFAGGGGVATDLRQGKGREHCKNRFQGFLENI